MSRKPEWKRDKKPVPRRYTIPGLSNAGIELKHTKEDTSYSYTMSKAMTDDKKKKKSCVFVTLDAMLEKWRKMEIGDIDDVKRDTDVLLYYRLRLKDILLKYNTMDAFCAERLFDNDYFKDHKAKMAIFKEIWDDIIEKIKSWKKETDGMIVDEIEYEKSELKKKIHKHKKSLSKAHKICKYVYNNPRKTIKGTLYYINCYNL